MATEAAPASVHSDKPRLGDRIFSGLSMSAASVILLILAGVALFLSFQAVASIEATHADISYIPRDGNVLSMIWPWMFGTLWVSVLAVIMAVPIAFGVALYITQFAPKRIASTIGYIIDLLAAVPSVVFGLWGVSYFSGVLTGPYAWMTDNLGWIPLFDTDSSGPYQLSTSGRTIMTAAIVLAVMILPIITALSREVFLQTPRLHKEAALALGATRWEMIKMSVFPYGRSGMVSSVMLGLGRALGETMAVAMVLSASGAVSFKLLANTNPTPIPAGIAQGYKEASGVGVQALIAAGLALFIITLLVNLAARAIVNRRKEFSGAN